jgi:hypothetical protein
VSPKSALGLKASLPSEPLGIWHAQSGESEVYQEELWIFAKGSEPDLRTVTTHGAWGWAPGAIPDSDGKYKPEDMWFFSPDEVPPSDVTLSGIWTYPFGIGGAKISTYKFRFEGENMIYTKRTEIHGLDTPIVKLSFL